MLRVGVGRFLRRRVRKAAASVDDAMRIQSSSPSRVWNCDIGHTTTRLCASAHTMRKRCLRDLRREGETSHLGRFGEEPADPTSVAGPVRRLAAHFLRYLQRERATPAHAPPPRFTAHRVPIHAEKLRGERERESNPCAWAPCAQCMHSKLLKNEEPSEQRASSAQAGGAQHRREQAQKASKPGGKHARRLEGGGGEGGNGM